MLGWSEANIVANWIPQVINGPHKVDLTSKLRTAEGSDTKVDSETAVQRKSQGNTDAEEHQSNDSCVQCPECMTYSEEGSFV